MEELTAEIERLEAENRELDEWRQSVYATLREMTEFYKDQKNQLDIADYLAMITRLRVDSLRYELQDPDHVPPQRSVTEGAE
ncbi:MAG: hypothetical protein K6G16_07555 [Lachnospiraceae bacterium]|nr:hypothetical protein [Lachnospiraceae bacterium]